MTEISERKKNGQIKGLISRGGLILSYTLQLTLLIVCTKFHHPMSSSSREIFDRNFHIHYTGVTDGKTTKWKKN